MREGSDSIEIIGALPVCSSCAISCRHYCQSNTTLAGKKTLLFTQQMSYLSSRHPVSACVCVCMCMCVTYVCMYWIPEAAVYREAQSISNALWIFVGKTEY